MNRIKELRKSRGVRQKDLAEYLCVAQNTLSYWENGKYEPDIEHLTKMANYFYVSTDYLIGNSDNHSAPNDQTLIISEPIFDHVRVAFHRGEFEGLNQSEVDKLAEFAEFLKSQRIKEK